MSIYDNAGVALIPSGTKASKLYSVLPANGDGDFTHSRGSTATRVNKDGFIESVATNVPRLDYPLIDGEVQDCPALLLEPSRTNLVLRSEELNTTWLTFRSSVTANDIVSPDGSQNAEKIIQQSGQTSSGGVYQNLTLSSSTVYTYSVFLKAGGYDFGMIRIDGGQYAWFDLSLGAVGSITGSGSSSIEDFGNGWYRCSFTITTTSTTGQPHIYIANSDGSQTLSDADGVKGIYAWGAVVEQGSYPTSYIKTTSGQVTRSADVCNGSGTSAEFNDSEGVLFLETSMLSSNPNDSTFQIDDGTSTNRVRIRFTTTTNQINGLLYSGVSGQPNINYTANDVTNQNKVAVRYQVGQIDLFFNGFEVGTITGNATPTGFDNLSLGTEGNVKQAMTFKTALTDSELETLTSWDSFNAMAKGQLYTIE
jgi:hypothetical protein